jgi:hypothetical protein
MYNWDGEVLSIVWWLHSSTPVVSSLNQKDLVSSVKEAVQQPHVLCRNCGTCGCSATHLIVVEGTMILVALKWGSQQDIFSVLFTSACAAIMLQWIEMYFWHSLLPYTRQSYMSAKKSVCL